MRIALMLFLWSVALAEVVAAEPKPIVGQTEEVYTLAEENKDIRGLAIDDASAGAPRLLTLDRSGRVFIYQITPRAEGRDKRAQPAALQAIETLDLNAESANLKLTDPQGLALAMEDGRQIFYFVDLVATNGAVHSRLVRYKVGTNDIVSIDLSLSMYSIGDRGVFDVACDRGEVLLAFDSSGYPVPDLRVQRGLARYRWSRQANDLEFVKHMPDAGTEPSRGITTMELDGASYLWATIGNEQIYCADGPTGRGLFFFNRPRSDEKESTCSGLSYGAGALWVAENVPGSDRVHRVNVTENLDAWYEGPRVMRRLRMTIRSEPEGDVERAGAVYHYYSRPYPYEQFHNQGVWPETESFVDSSNASNATLKSFTYDPADDPASRQTMWVAEYPDGPARNYSSQYEIDLWTNPYKKFVYPHRVDLDRSAIEGTNYLADDPELYNLSDTKTYVAFIERVKAHIKRKYDVEADMKNPYWAARNVVEYIQDNYYYPIPPKRRPAAVDYGRKHYDANPANLKIELSDHPYDKNQIIACSGTSVMVAGAMRHLGFPARWLGTGTQMGPDTWDTNKNGLLDADESAPSTNGHRYSQVWLGSHYGWICFDATPSRPDHSDFDPPPPLQSQWRYMTRAASGHRVDNRVVYNVGSALFRPLYRDFEYDPQLAIDNNCGGDQRYNLQGRFEKPELWKLARNHITLTNLCFVTSVKLSGPKQATQVTWELEGAWDRCPDATLSIFLQQLNDAGLPQDLARLAHGIAHSAKTATLDLSGYHGKQLRILLRKDGDPETGGISPLFAQE